MGRRRIAITGLGMVTPLGNDAPTTWAAVRAGRSGIAPITHFDARGFDVRIGAEVKGFQAAAVRHRKLLKYLSPSHCFAVAAAEEALRDADILPNEASAHRWGCAVGSGMLAVAFQELQTVQTHCAPDGLFQADGLLDDAYPVDPITFCRTQPNAGLAMLTRYFGISGYATSVHTACASGGQAIGTALKALRRGDVDYMLAGGFDSMLSPTGLGAFCLLGALSTDNETPESASRPFDLTRNGFVLGEGAGFLVLENWASARRRGARIYAELAGNGDSLSSYRVTDSSPSGDGPIQAMQRALADAEMPVDELDYVNAHGTSTPMNDRSECAALRQILDRHNQRVFVSSTKSCTGHLIAAAGAVEAALCTLSIQHGIAPVNANYSQPDPTCDVNLVLDESRPMTIRGALSNSLGFGGSNSCLAFRHPDQVADSGS